jgi:hypothetical protein
MAKRFKWFQVSGFRCQDFRSEALKKKTANRSKARFD